MTTKQLTQTYSDLVKTESYYNPMFLNGRQIEHLVFYDADKGTEILNGWDGLRWFGSNNNYPLIRFPFEFKKANKVDLTRKDAYYTTFQHTYSYDKGKIVLYIPIHLVDSFTDLGEVLQFETDTEKNFRHSYSFKVMAQSDEYYLDEFEELKSRTTELKECTIEFSGRYRMELKPFGEKVKTITERIKTVYPEISVYDVEKIMTVCNVELK